MIMAIWGALAKAGAGMLKGKAKKVAADKLLGRGKKKPQKPKNPFGPKPVLMVYFDFWIATPNNLIYLPYGETIRIPPGGDSKMHHPQPARIRDELTICWEEIRTGGGGSVLDGRTWTEPPKPHPC